MSALNFTIKTLQGTGFMLNRMMAVSAVLWLMGCSQETEQDVQSVSSVALSPPDFLLESKTIDEENYTPTLSIDNKIYALAKSGGQWTGTFNVAANESYQIRVDWNENYKGRQLPMASATKTVEVGSSAVSAQIASADYDTTSFDEDSDGLSNLDERNNNSNPFVHLNVENTSVVSVPRLPLSASTPNIDGIYNADEWIYATEIDKADAQLLINKLLFVETQGADVSTQVSRWQAVHDGNYLYLLIFSNDQKRTNDSSNAWADDNLNIYIDGDYSQYQGYDGINDYHIMVPLLERNSTAANISSASSSRIQQGTNSATLPRDLSFATGISAGPVGNRGTKMDVYELRISLAQTGIVVGELFGMDLHLDDDDDGGARDSKWSWYLKSGDLSYQYTDVLAAIVLEQ